MIVKPTIALGCPVENLWDVLTDDGRKVSRVSYHGNKLVVVSGELKADRLATAEHKIKSLTKAM